MKNILQKIFVNLLLFVLVAYSIVVLLNPLSVATPEIPDAVPFIGNIDDVAAMLIISGAIKRWTSGKIDLIKYPNEFIAGSRK